jgi:two-component system, NtrC family, sensor histidine kinase PilS
VMDGTRSSSLEPRLKRLMLFRVVMITTLLLIAIYVEAVSETLRPVNPLYYLIAATYALTILYALALRFAPHPEAQVYVQVAVDLLIITGLVYLTGGTGNRTGFILLYPISVLSGSVLLYRGKGLLLAGLATLFYAGVLVAVRSGAIPPQGLADVPFMLEKHLLYSVFVTGVSCATVALIGSYLSESLRAAGEQLEEAAGQVADLQELNKVIVDSIHSGLITADSGGHILYVNNFGESILGVRTADIKGRPLRELLGSPLLEPLALQARASYEGLARFEVVYRRPDGTALDLGVSVSPLATAQPEGGHLLVFQNLTEIKRLERQVRIKEKLAAVGEMAAQLAHEIRNPLGSISGSAQVLMGEANMSEEQERLLAIITRESKRLSETLNHFLYQARPSLPPSGPVDIGRAVEEAVTLLRNAPEVREGQTVEFEADEGPHVCLADPDQIKQVFWNLARNGLEAMPAGGVLHVRLSCRGDDLVLAVRDQGRGMGHDEQQRVFEPFHSDTPMGTGLGLAIVYRIVREHRGDITVRSAPARGTEVEVRLPRVLVTVPV